MIIQSKFLKILKKISTLYFNIIEKLSLQKERHDGLRSDLSATAIICEKLKAENQTKTNENMKLCMQIDKLEAKIKAVGDTNHKIAKKSRSCLKQELEIIAQGWSKRKD